MNMIAEPLSINGHRLKNRIVMAPLVRFGMESHDGIFGEELMQEYLDYEGQEIGLAIIQCLSVSPENDPDARCAGTSGGAGIYDDSHIDQLRQIGHILQKDGTCVFAQLGLFGYSYGEMNDDGFDRMPEEELEDLIELYVKAAVRCKKAGLDGVELHGAHTYFLNMSFSSLANNRTDRFGGSPEKRVVFIAELIKRVRQAVGDSFLIGVRMGWGQNTEEDLFTARAIESAGADLLHISYGIPRERTFPADYDYHGAVYVAEQVTKQVKIPVIASNGIETAAKGEILLERGACDLVAYGRPFLADHGFAAKALKDPGYRPCRDCQRCMWFTDRKKCPGAVK